MSISPERSPSDRDRGRFRVPWRRRSRWIWSWSVSSPCRRYPLLSAHNAMIWHNNVRARGLLWTRRIVVTQTGKGNIQSRPMCKSLNIRLTPDRFGRICAVFAGFPRLTPCPRTRLSLMTGQQLQEAVLAILRDGYEKVAFSMPGGESSDTRRSRPIDLAHLSHQTMGDRDLEREVLGLFAEQVEYGARADRQSRDQGAAFSGACLEGIGTRRRRFRDRRMRSAPSKTAPPTAWS